MPKATILFADNDPDFLVTRAEFLRQEGYQVIPVSDVATARRMLEQGDIDLAILDIRLVNDDDEKDASGIALARDAAYRDIPKIVLTNFPSTAAAVQALRTDTDGQSPVLDFVTKEEGPEVMLKAIRQALSVSRRQQTEWIPYVSLVTLAGIVISGGIAIVFADARWVVGTIGLAVLYAVFTWWVLINRGHSWAINLRRPRQRTVATPSLEKQEQPAAISLDVPAQLLKDYEAARQQAMRIHWIWLGLIVAGGAIILGGFVVAINGYASVGIAGTAGGAIAETLGLLLTKFAADANRRWEQFHKELVMEYRKQQGRKEKQGK